MLYKNMLEVKKITILIPLYNEAAVLTELMNRLESLILQTRFELDVLLVDDGSTDDTAIIIQRAIFEKDRFSAIFLSRNFGHAKALTAGLAHINEAIDAVFIIDGDLQDPPELLENFVTKMNDGFDVVYGVRNKRKEGYFKKLSYKYYYRLLKQFANIKNSVKR